MIKLINMKIIFDSNVWQIITIPENFPDDPFQDDFKIIRQAIIDKKIKAFLSETIFTIEAIRKIERQDYFASRKAKIDITENETSNGWINSTFTLRPEKGIDFNERPILKKYFDEALKLGFKIVRLPRIAGMVNEEIESLRYKQTGDELKLYLEKVSEVVGEIENLGAGKAQIDAIGKLYDPIAMKGLKKAPVTERNKIAKAAAEWADGDSVAISIAMNCDYFCTRDQAKGAGSKSVLSVSNLAWLRTNYNFETILPENLSKLI